MLTKSANEVRAIERAVAPRLLRPKRPIDGLISVGGGAAKVLGSTLLDGKTHMYPNADGSPSDEALCPIPQRLQETRFRTVRRDPYLMISGSL